MIVDPSATVYHLPRKLPTGLSEMTWFTNRCSLTSIHTIGDPRVHALDKYFHARTYYLQIVFTTCPVSGHWSLPILLASRTENGLFAHFTSSQLPATGARHFNSCCTKSMHWIASTILQVSTQPSLIPSILLGIILVHPSWPTGMKFTHHADTDAMIKLPAAD